MHLLTLIGQDTPLKKIASTSGGEWAGPCPFCGGTDRFRVQPERGRWWCRQCSPDERWEDAIAYVRRRDGVGFEEARGRVSATEPLYGLREAHTRPLPRSEAPDPQWQAQAALAARTCVEQLWMPVGDRARAWLHGRGLEDKTLERWGVGYSSGQTLESLWIPRGIILPWWVRGELWQLKVRRPVIRSDEPKYASVKGGKPYLFGLDHLAGQDVLVLAEGEFDALLLWQEVRQLVDVATLGSCSGAVTEQLLWELMPYRRLLVAYDADEGGESGALKLQCLSKRIRRMGLPAGSDVTDFHLAGGSLSDWIAWQLR